MRPGVLQVRVMPNYSGDSGKWYYGAFNNLDLTGKFLFVQDTPENCPLYYAKIIGKKALKPVFKSDCAKVAQELPKGAVVKDNS